MFGVETAPSLLYHRLIRIQRPGSLFARDDAILYEMSMETEAQKMPYFKYLFSSFIAMLPTMICITVFGGEPSLTSPAFWIAVGIKVIVFAAAYFKNHKLAVEH